MTRFSQWWRRSVRGGYGALKLTLFGPPISRGIFRRQVQSVLAWGIGLPLVAIALVGVAGAGGLWPWSLAALMTWPVALVIQGARLAAKAHRQGCRTPDALAYAVFTLLLKQAALVGFMMCLLDRRHERATSVLVTREFHKSAA